MTETKTKDQWKKLLEGLRETGHDFGDSLEKVALYAEARTEHLATLVGQPGFDQAVTAELHNTLLKAGVKAADLGDAADQKIFWAIAGGLRIGATALAGVV